MAQFHSRRRRPHLISRGRGLGVRTPQLSFETLESRLVLSTGPLADYDAVSPAWFSTAGSTAGGERWIVRLTAEAAAQAGNVAGAASLLADLPVTIERGLGLTGQLLVTSRAEPGQVAAALAGSRALASYQPDARISGSILPNDPDVNNGPHATALSQYALYNIGQFGGTVDADIDADDAWNITTGSASVVTAVIDSGIFYAHPDLAANIWTNPGEIPGNGVDDDGNGFVDDVRGWDFHNNDNDPIDDHGHGTHVAGAIGAVGNNGLGGVGVNWTTSLMALKFLDENNVGSVVDAVAAINYATMMRTRPVNPVNVRVINASWGGAGVDDQALRAAIAASAAADILFVAAAGNGDVFGRGQNIDELPFFPASFNLDNMLVVGATDRNDQLTTFSNYGVQTVDIVAPGLSVWNTNVLVEGQSLTASQGVRSGTSMATPLVAGVAALAWAAAPLATASEVRDAILAGGDGYNPSTPAVHPALAALQGKIASGKRLNALGALKALPPQAQVTSALVVTAGNVGETSYQFTVQLSSHTGLAAGSVGNGDFVVRRKGSTGADIVATLVTAPPAGTTTQWTGTYQITPPGGAWDVLDGAAYEIVLVAGQVVDTAGVASRQKAVGQFVVDLSGIGVFHPTATTDGGAGSLRAAVALANAVTQAQNPAGGTVVLAPGIYRLTIGGAGEDAGATGDLDVTGKVTIASDGTPGEVIILAEHGDRILDVHAGASLKLQGVRLMGGNAGAGAGGAIRNAGTLEILSSSIVDNSAFDGGGLWNGGVLTLTQSTVADNAAQHNGGGLYNAAGATATIVASTINDNTAAGYETEVLDKVGGRTLVNGVTAGTQFLSRIGMNASGQAVVTWTTYLSSLDQKIYAQRIDANGVLVGGQINVAIDHARAAYFGDPAVGPDGKFAVGYNWEEDTTIHKWNAAVRLFDENGLPIGGYFSPADNTVGHQFEAEVSADVNGNYDVAWRDGNDRDGNGDGVYVQRFSSQGVELNSETVVPNNTQGYQHQHDIAHFENSEAVVVWTENGIQGSGMGVFARFLNSSGLPSPAAPQFLVNQIPGNPQNACVAASGDGFVVTWRDPARGIIARKFSRSGQAISGDIVVASTLADAYATPAMFAGGAFAVTWSQPGASVYDVFVQGYDAAGNPLGGPLKINSAPAQFLVRPWIASDRDGRATVAWDGSETAQTANLGDPLGVFVQRLSYHKVFHGGDGGGVYNAGALTTTSATVSGNASGSEGGGVYNAATATITTLVNSTIVENQVVAAAPAPLLAQGEAFRISQATAGTQSAVDLAVNATGRAVVTWTTTVGPGNQGVYARVLDNLTPSGLQNEFPINPSNNAIRSNVGVNGAGGAIFAYLGAGFGPTWDVRARVLNPTGGFAAGAFDATDANTAQQDDPVVSTNASGRTVVAWSDAGLDGSGYGAFARVFDAAGAPLTDVFQVSGPTANHQLVDDALMLDDGSMLITWRGFGPGDPDGYGVFARFFNADGTPRGDDIRINAQTAGQQSDSRIARIDGGYAIVWSSRTTTASIQGQLLDANGNLVGGQFPVGTTAVTHDVYASVAPLLGGGFVVAWPAYDAASNTESIMARAFSASGAAVTNAFVVYASHGGEQNSVRVATDAAGNVLFVWSGSGLGDDAGILARRYFQTTSAAGVHNASGTAVEVRNSIIATNASGVAPDVTGKFTSLGGNLVGDVNSVLGFTQATDQVGNSFVPRNPLLGELADNGGPTQTHLPAANSPAIDAGVAGGPTHDQRGILRTADGNGNGVGEPDVGAVELFHGSIRGRKFKDDNQNGVQDGAETGVAGWTLFLDGFVPGTTPNGRLDPGEPTAVTNAQGDYVFAQLAPGTYTVAEANQPGWSRTYTSTVYGSHAQDGVGGVLGLTNVHELAISPDGKHAYAINNDPLGPDAIVTFSRHAATGALTFVSRLVNNQNDGAGTLVTGLEGEGHVVVSPNGAFVFAVGTAENAIVVFHRNPATGVLTFAQRITTATSPNDVVVSANSQNIYVLGNSGSSLIFYQRNAGTGVWSALQSRAQVGPALVLAPNEAYVYGTNGSNLFAYSRNTSNGTLGTNPVFTPFTAGQPAPGGGVADALTDVTDLAMAVDPATGKTFLYTLSRGDQSIGVYQQNPATGSLQFIEKVTRGVADGAGRIVEGLEGAKSLAISPVGDRVYVTGDADVAEDDSLAVFRRDPETGRLYFEHAVRQLADDGLGYFVTTLTDPDGVAISPDGRSIYVAARDGLITEGAVTQFLRDGKGLDRKTVQVGQVVDGVNFSGYAPPGEIFGIVYSDLNNNGARDLDERPLGGVTVYIDANGNNQWDAGEAKVVTDANGQYAFPPQLAPATYVVRVIPAGNQTVTFPPASVDREWTVHLAPAELRGGIDFLLYGALVGQGVQITGAVWQDLDGDGVKQSGEPFLVGREVYLDVNDNGQYDAGVDVLTTTGANGIYSFDSLSHGTFVVRVLLNSGETTSNLAANAFTKQSYATGSQPLVVAAHDFNNDDKPDLATVDQYADQVTVRLQGAGGAFGDRAEYGVGAQPTGLVVGNFNNDALPDIAVVHWSLSRIVFLINQPANPGTFVRGSAATEILLPTGFTTIAVADFDGDGDDDLAVAIDRNPSEDVVLLFANNKSSNPNNPLPSFTQLSQHSLDHGGPASIAAGDLTGDGRPEIVVGNFVANAVRVLRNNPGATFTGFTLQPAVGVAEGPASVVIAPDMNGDGKKDVVTANIGGLGKVTILAGDGLGGLSTAAVIDVGAGPRSVAVVDVDADGDLDLLVGKVSLEKSNNVNDVEIFRRQGTALQFSFAESSGLASFASLGKSGFKHVVAARVNADDVPDLIAVRGDANGGKLEVLYNALAAGARRVNLIAAGSAVGQDFGVKSSGPTTTGDYDGDSDADGHDFLVWQRTLGATGVPVGAGADGFPDGVINGADLMAWKSRFGSQPAVVAAASAGVVADVVPAVVRHRPTVRDALTRSGAILADRAFDVWEQPRGRTLRRQAEVAREFAARSCSELGVAPSCAAFGALFAAPRTGGDELKSDAEVSLADRDGAFTELHDAAEPAIR